MNNLVSIITPSYNSEQFIMEVIESVQNQTYENWEMIIVDDLSLDKSVYIIKKYMEIDSRIKLIELNKNSGPVIARNRAIKEAKGRYIAFLDSDDFWHKNKLAQQLEFMKEKDVAFSYTGYYTVDEDTSESIGLMEVVNVVDYHTLLKQNIIGCLTVIYDSKKLGKIYMPNIAKRQDFALWLEILKKVPFAYGLNEPLAYYRIRTISVSSNKFKASLYNWKLYRDIEKLSLHKAIYYFAWYTYNSIFHKRNRK